LQLDIIFICIGFNQVLDEIWRKNDVFYDL